MPVYVDPTEVREGTRLPEQVVKVAQVCAGLKAATGADMLITPNGVLMPGSLTGGTDLARLALERACEHGVLVQLITGLQFEEGRLVAGERRTEWTVQSVKGAFRAWRFRGGHIEVLPSDDDLPQWVSETHEAVSEFAQHPVKWTHPQEPVQVLHSEQTNWVTTGSGFPPGIGREKRNAIALALDPECVPGVNPPPLIRVLDHITSGRVMDAQGIGRKLLGDLRKWYGLSTGKRIKEVPPVESIAIRFPKALPVRLTSDGIEVTEDGEGVTYRFHDYAGIETLAMVLSAMDWRADRKDTE